MRPWIHIVAAVAALGGCSFDADYGDTQLMCSASAPRCPAGYACVNDVCVVPGAIDAATDGVGPDASVCQLAMMEGENDTCGGARDLTPLLVSGSATVHGDTTGYANDLTPSTLPDCTGSPEPGPDAIFRVSLSAGDMLGVTFSPDGGWVGDVYVTDACTGTADCLDGTAQFTPMTVPITTAGTYYIVVDSRNAGVSGCFSLAVNVTP